MTNALYYGDNLDVLRESIASESVDLIYLDPPFNSNATYNVLFKSKAGVQSQAQIEAFEDTWSWGKEAELAVSEVTRSGNSSAADLLIAMQSFLGSSNMMAYLAMMAIRILELHRVLKPSGAMYLHCDPTASHYLKLLIDATFGPENFRSEIVWRRSGSHNSTSRQFGLVHDCIMVVSKSKDHRLRPMMLPYTKSYIEGEFRFSDGRGKYRLNEIMGPGKRNGDSGTPWQGYDPSLVGRHWAIPDSLKLLLPNDGIGLTTQTQLDLLLKEGEIYVSKHGRPKYKQRPNEGVPLQDIWAFQPGTENVLWQALIGFRGGERFVTQPGQR